MFDYEKIQRSALATLAALILSSTAIAAAIGPVHSVETAPAAYAEVAVADRADG